MAVSKMEIVGFDRLRGVDARIDSLFFQLVQYLYKLGFDNSPLRIVRHHNRKSRGLYVPGLFLFIQFLYSIF